MSIAKMKKEELELLSNKDITEMILEESKKTMNTASLFKKIIKLLDLPESTFEEKIGDYYTALSTDKRFILLDNGNWDLRSKHTSDKLIKVSSETDDELDDEDIEEDLDKEEEEELEDDYSDGDTTYDTTDEDLKDLVVIDEEELEE